jgi:hypothetical protein
MEINPRPLVARKLKEMAAKEGISVNAMLVPFLNDIASGKLVRGYSYQEPLKPQ